QYGLLPIEIFRKRAGTQAVQMYADLSSVVTHLNIEHRPCCTALLSTNPGPALYWHLPDDGEALQRKGDLEVLPIGSLSLQPDAGMEGRGQDTGMQHKVWMGLCRHRWQAEPSQHLAFPHAQVLDPLIG